MARVVALVLFVLVTLGVTFLGETELELIAAGLAFYVLSDFLPD